MRLTQKIMTLWKQNNYKVLGLLISTKIIIMKQVNFVLLIIGLSIKSLAGKLTITRQIRQINHGLSLTHLTQLHQMSWFQTRLKRKMLIL